MLNNPIAASVVFSVFLPLGVLVLLFVSKRKPNSKNLSKLPRSYPIVGSFFSIIKNVDRFPQWSAEIVNSTPALTFTLHRSFRTNEVITANPDTVQHILKSNFHNYPKEKLFHANLNDLLGDGIFNADGENWKFQRQVAAHEFNTKSLRRFVETVVDSELSDRLIPILEMAASPEPEQNTLSVLDFQDILQRFAFDNICKIAFGYDPEYLSPSLPKETFAIAFEKAVQLSAQRFRTFIPYSWKINKALNIGSEKEMNNAVSQVRELATKIVREKLQAIQGKSPLDDDLLSRFLSSGNSNEEFVTDIVISFILAGRDTTSAALTWFFWLLSNHPEVERNILMEINEKGEGRVSAYDEVKEMVYTHASLCETMRLYPPVPMDGKEALNDDVLPDGTVVKKGMTVTYSPYAMGRVEKVWGKDWAEFRPERWLERDASTGKWNFVNRNAYIYPVFQAGPRICLGKEMAFIQMKRVVTGVLRRFRVVPAMGEGVEPVFVTALTAKMKGGFPVRIQARA